VDRFAESRSNIACRDACGYTQRRKNMTTSFDGKTFALLLATTSDLTGQKHSPKHVIRVWERTMAQIRALGCYVRRICSPTVIRCNVASVAP
jgi:hypothetical protein